MNLDIKDKKILLILDTNARATNSQIAKQVGLSKQLTSFRIKRLEKNNIIKSYSAVIDHAKLGLKPFRVYLKLENTTLKKETEILNYLKLYAGWMASVLGNWDISFAIYSKDEYDFQEFWENFLKEFRYYIKESKISLITEFLNFEKSFIFPEQKNRKKIFILGKKSPQEKLDKIDVQIIKELSVNARIPILELSKKIKTTARIASYRIKELERKEIIKGYRSFLNINELNLKFYKVLIELKDSKQEDVEKIKSHLSNHPNVAYVSKAIGGSDFEPEVYFENTKKLIAFISQIKEKFPTNIKEISHMEYIKEHKLSYL